MKKILTFFTLLLLVASCTKEVDISQNEMSGMAVTFTASVVDMAETRATLKTSWSGDEEVALFVGETLYRYTIAKDGTMSGDEVIVDRDASITYKTFYPYNENFETVAQYESACIQGNIDYISATTTTSNNREVALQFSHQMAALSFTVLIEGTITNCAISLLLDGTTIALEVDASISAAASRLVANYFVADGTDISSAMIKLEYSGSTTFHSIKRDDTNTLVAGKQYPYSYTIGDIPTAGSGSKSDPYVVHTAADMRKVGTDTYDWALDSHYILAWDIDLGSEEFTAIGTSSSPFTGTFDGDGHEISGLYINQPSSDYQALFGCIYNGATIKNLTVSGSVTGKNYVGGVVGLNNEGCMVSECYNNGSVEGSGTDVGGVVGFNCSTLSNCYNTGSVEGSGNYVGGVVGYSASSATVSYCYNTGSVDGSSSYVGGVVGYNSFTAVSNCYNTGSIEGSERVGGVVGYNSSTAVSNCYNTGEVSGSKYVGGVVGYNSAAASSTVSYCYNTGSVVGSSNVGGVVGYINFATKVSYCYFLDTAYSGSGVGYSNGTIEDVVSKTESQMQATDFVSLLNGEDGTSWMSDYAKPINDGYPILSWQTSNN